jgi:hypothetical protein
MASDSGVLDSDSHADFSLPSTSGHAFQISIEIPKHKFVMAVFSFKQHFYVVI